MGKIAVVHHGGSKITLSMIRFGLPRRMLLHLARRFRLVDRFRFPLFTPKYEIAIFDGSPKVVFSLRNPHFVFYYPDANTASRKWGELTDGGRARWAPRKRNR